MVETNTSFTGRQGNNKKKNLVIIIGLFTVIVIVVGAVFIMRQSKKTDQKEVLPIDEIKKQELVSPTEMLEIDKQSVKIQVLNGTGTPGQAGTVVDALKDAGYETDNIKADNAEEFDNTATTITVKSGYTQIAKDIKSSLEAVFDEIKIESSSLDEDNEFDVVIVTGGEKYEEEEEAEPTESAPSPTTTTTVTPDSTSSSTPTPTLSPSPTP